MGKKLNFITYKLTFLTKGYKSKRSKNLQKTDFSQIRRCGKNTWFREKRIPHPYCLQKMFSQTHAPHSTISQQLLPGQVFSTKRNEYEEMKLYGIGEGKVCLILGDASVRGDITCVLYHARQQLGRVIGIKIAALHFHTGYVPLADTCLSFDKPDLDDQPEVGAGKFRVVVNAMAGEDSAKFARVPAPWEAAAAEDDERQLPDPLFGSTLEMEETLENFRGGESTSDVSSGFFVRFGLLLFLS